MVPGSLRGSVEVCVVAMLSKSTFWAYMLLYTVGTSSNARSASARSMLLLQISLSIGQDS